MTFRIKSRNYFIIHLDSGERKQITFHENPYPHISSLKKEIVTYTRSDGVKLSGTLYYPLNYDAFAKNQNIGTAQQKAPEARRANTDE